MTNSYQVLDLGLTDYRQAYSLQKSYLNLVKSKVIDGIILLTEHRPVFTLGRSASLKNILDGNEKIRSCGIEVVETDRGGDITFHGPGQLVAYPIFDLTRHHRDIHKYIRYLEEVVIHALSDFGILSFRISGLTGVWVDEGKIASVGIGVSRWVAYHGLAINANVDLKYFDMICPCGLKNISMSSMSSLTNSLIDLRLLKERLVKHFSALFDY